MTKTPRAQKSVEAKPRKRAADNPEQYRRFREFARDHDADESKETFNLTVERLLKRPPHHQ
jgi:hypothetical protein